jgi:hypothetical protein
MLYVTLRTLILAFRSRGDLAAENPSDIRSEGGTP